MLAAFAPRQPGSRWDGGDSWEDSESVQLLLPPPTGHGRPCLRRKPHPFSPGPSRYYHRSNVVGQTQQRHPQLLHIVIPTGIFTVCYFLKHFSALSLSSVLHVCFPQVHVLYVCNVCVSHRVTRISITLLLYPSHHTVLHVSKDPPRIPNMYKHWSHVRTQIYYISCVRMYYITPITGRYYRYSAVDLHDMYNVCYEVHV